jgi:hypothetical protein
MSQRITLFVTNLPVFLIGIDLLAIAVVPHLFGDHDPWYVTAIIATVLGTVHALIFWFIQEQQRSARRQAIAEVRMMMQDQIKNQLSIIVTSTYLVTRSHDSAVYVDRINSVVDNISTGLDSLSEESLTEWHRRYNVEGIEQPRQVNQLKERAQ